MSIHHFYHVWASGDLWEEPFREHIVALVLSGLADKLESMTVGVIGSDNRIEDVASRLPSFAKIGATSPGCPPTNSLGVNDRNECWEQLTLEMLVEQAKRGHPDDEILYCHTKGAWSNSFQNVGWRRSMTIGLVWRHERCLDLLKTYDTVGMYWQGIRGDVSSPYWAGNFWWANAGYINTCDPLRYYSRYEAEAFIGRGQRLKGHGDMCPGTPVLGNWLQAPSTWNWI